MTSGELIADELRSALRVDPWHGPSLVSLVDDLSVQEAVQRPIPAAPGRSRSCFTESPSMTRITGARYHYSERS